MSQRRTPTGLFDSISPENSLADGMVLSGTGGAVLRVGEACGKNFDFSHDSIAGCSAAQKIAKYVGKEARS